ncbi:MAG TPA: hypothetical protein VGQ59_09120, partial [Cyclobacteriaceae bacterium]|nr:hypothetical protein [Cyclobacteriaceae bacterium]
MRNVILVAVIVILSGCEYNNVAPEKPAGDNENYLPLKVGNYWDFEMMSPSQGQSSIQVHREVTAVVTVNHHEYYLLINSSDA